MKRHFQTVLVWAGCCLTAAVAGCSSQKPAWEAGASWHDFSNASLTQLKSAEVVDLEVFLADVTKLPPGQRAAKCQQIAENARNAGVVLWSAHIPFGKGWDISVTDPAQHEKAMANNREAIQLCAELGVKKAVIHASAEPIRNNERQARLEVARKSLRELAAECAAIHVQLALEDLPRTCLGNTSDEILWLSDGIDNLGVCFDTNHLLKEKPEDFVRKVGPRIVTLHVSDYDGKDERHWMPGEGIINWPSLAASLAAIGYHGPFLYETSKHKSGTTITPAEYSAFVRTISRDIRRSPEPVVLR